MMHYGNGDEPNVYTRRCGGTDVNTVNRASNETRTILQLKSKSVSKPVVMGVRWNPPLFSPSPPTLSSAGTRNINATTGCDFRHGNAQVYVCPGPYLQWINGIMEWRVVPRPRRWSCKCLDTGLLLKSCLNSRAAFRITEK